MKYLVTGLFCIMLLGCGGGNDSAGTTVPEPTPPVPAPSEPSYTPISSEFLVATPADVGLQDDQVAVTYSMASSNPDLKAMLVLKDGALVAEQYFNGTQSQDLLQIRSVTKTVVAMFTGILLEGGDLDSLDITVGELFSDDYPELIDSQKASINLRHLLTMTSGFDWDESEFNTWVNSLDPVAYLLQKPMATEPGSRFLYNSAGSHLLWVALGKLIPDVETQLEFALLQPLGIDQYRWERVAGGSTNGGAGLQLRAVDLAKLGLLLLDQGIHTDHAQGSLTEVMPGSWVNSMLSAQLPLDSEFGEFNIQGYSYLTWVGEAAGEKMVLPWGWGGQFIALFPERGLIVVTNNEHFVPADQARLQEQASLDLIANGILQALD